VDRIPGTVERRGVGKIQPADIVEAQPRPEGTGKDIDPANRPHLPYRLRAEEFPRRLIGNQLQAQFFVSGHGAGEGVPPDKRTRRMEAALDGIPLDRKSVV
jgi:hypothetical protein